MAFPQVRPDMVKEPFGSVFIGRVIHISGHQNNGFARNRRCILKITNIHTGGNNRHGKILSIILHCKPVLSRQNQNPVSTAIHTEFIFL